MFRYRHKRKSKKSLTDLQKQQETKQQGPVHLANQTHPQAVLQRVKQDPSSLTQADVLQLQRTIGNQAVGDLIEAKHGSPQSRVQNNASPVQGSGNGLIQLARTKEPPDKSAKSAKLSASPQKAASEKPAKLAKSSASPQKEKTKLVEASGTKDKEKEKVTTDNTLPLKDSGMDKKYYYREDQNDGYGWLETSSAVMKRELEAYKTLKGMLKDTEFKLPDIKTVSEKPAPMIGNEKGENGQLAKSGYWIEHIPRSSPFNLKMSVLKAANLPTKIYKQLEGEAKAKMKGGISNISFNFDKIARVAGELTSAVQKMTGEADLLDAAPQKGENVGGEDLAPTVKKKLENILNKLD